MPTNPYVSAAQGAQSHALQLASTLRSAASQQERLREEQRIQAQRDHEKQSMSEQMDMARLLNEGWQTYNPSHNVTADPATGLKRRDYVPRRTTW